MGKTGFDKYFDSQMRSATFKKEYTSAREEIDNMDEKISRKEFQRAVFKYLADHKDGAPAGARDLADMCEVDATTVWRWAKGTSCPHGSVREWVASWTR